MTIYIDLCTFSDYDKAINFLVDHRVVVIEQDRMKLCIAAQISDTLLEKMRAEVEFELTVITSSHAPPMMAPVRAIKRG